MKFNKMALLAATMILAVICLTACSGGNKNTGNNTETEKATDAVETTAAAAVDTEDKFVYTGTDAIIKTEELPEGYTLIPYEKFCEVFKKMNDGTYAQKTTYEELVEAFGIDGIRMANNNADGYAYYSWYSDKDYAGKKVSLYVTFRVKDGVKTYFAYTSNGITPQDVK